MQLLMMMVPLCLTSVAQVQIAGFVRDSLSRAPIPFATITILGSDQGEMGNENGGFHLDLPYDIPAVRVTAVGYEAKVMSVQPGQAVMVVDLLPSSVKLDEVLVEKSREKYSKKNNPAVALVERIRRHRDDTDPQRQPFYSYNKYERIMYGFNDLDDIQKNDASFKKFAFLAEYADTSAVTGKRVLPVSVTEKVSQEMFRRSPRTHKEYVMGLMGTGIDESLDDRASVKRFLDDVFREVDIYGNDVTMLTNRFVSPLSAIATDFYKFYLSDTLEIDGDRCVELSFVPHNTQSLGFVGRLYVVEGDTSCFVKRVKLNVPRHINLNYVERVHIEQDYVRSPDGSRLKVRDNMEVDFRLIKGTPGLFARRETAYRDHTFDRPDNARFLDQTAEQIVSIGAENMPEEFWADHRPAHITDRSNKVKNMLSRLRQSRLFYWGEKVIVALVKGYVPTGKNSKWDFGPINTTISGNPLEGVRLRLGGMTTVNLSRHWFVRGYAAYGTRDQKFKYMGQLEYSFNEKRHLDQEFPIHSLRLMHQYDVDRLGQNYLYTNADNVFLLLKRQKDNKLAYLRRTELEWKYESLSHFSVSLSLQHLVHESSRYITFANLQGDSWKHYTQAGFKVTLRYAPGEKFYQTRSYRIPINMDAPIVTLSHTYMPKGFLGSLYEVNKTELGLQKRFWFSAFGYTDIIVKGGKIWSKVAYPDLMLPNANLSYTIQAESYALMDAMEFANDQYLSWDLTYWANGAILNHVPLVKRLKLREVFTFRGLWGSLSDKNNPALTPQAMQFPANTNCQAMGKRPYMEIGVGLDNILTFLRLDYVWRLTYRDTPGVDRSGLRLQLHFTF